MARDLDIRIEQRLELAATLIALGVAGAGALVLCGWAFDIASLKSVLPGLATMKANTAVVFILIGLGLWLSRPQADGDVPRPALWLARVMGVVLGGVGLLTLCEYVFGWDVKIDQLLFHDPASSAGLQAPGRMALMSALNALLLALALLLLDVTTRNGRRPSNWLALAVAANSYLAILGYLYGVDSLYRVAALSAVALHTAILFVLASVGLACARPRSRFIRQIVGNNTAGQVNRRLLPAAVLIPPLLGWLRWMGEAAGYYSTAFGLALFTASNVTIFTLLAWWSARALQNIQDRRIAVTKVSAAQQAILNSADFTVISTDAEGMIRTINAGAVKMLGYAPEELIGKTPTVIHDPAEVEARAAELTLELGYDVAPGFEAFVAKARRNGSDEHDWTYVRKDGSQFNVRLSITPIRDAGGMLTGFLGIGNDITLRKQAEAKLLNMAQFDSLTGLANRNHFNDKLADAIVRSERNGHPLALVFLDLDHFKQINDTFGHPGGDLVLQEFASRLLRIVRLTDTVARLAGDEFVVILESLQGTADAELVATKIIASMEAPFRIFDEQCSVSASLGIAMHRAGEIDSGRLLRRADAALYQAKKSGRGCFRIDE